MIISKELFTGKKFADGSHPIAIRICHNGRSTRIFTSVSCRRCDWNLHHLCIIGKDPDFKIKNEAVETAFRRVSAGVQEHIDRCLDRDFDSLSEGLATNSEISCLRRLDELTLAKVAERKAVECVRLNTRRGYESFARYVRARFGDGLSIGDIDQNFIDRFASAIEADYSGHNAMRPLMVNRLKAVVRFAVANGWLQCLRGFRFPKYVAVCRDRNCSREELLILGKLALRETATSSLPPKGKALSLTVFLLCLAFQGIAPVDMASLRIKDLTFGKVRDGKTGRAMETVAVDIFRRKTGVPVHIVAYYPPIRSLLRQLMRGRTANDFLIPCFDKAKTYTDSQRQNRLSNFFHKLTESLNACLREECRQTGLEPPARITYYYARHAFCNLTDSLDIPHHLIRKLVGHRQTVLVRSYLRPPTDLEQALVSQSVLSLIGLA